MSHLSEIVDSLENRISKLLHTHLKMKQKNAQLEDEMAVLKLQQQRFHDEIESWREKHDTLKFANSILGSDDYKRDTKLKINALIREIDQCITELSE
jgi:predicted  nucleic acid-binding Zn-ribbon protein